MNFDTYIGQDDIKKQLKMRIDAANIRGDALPHVILAGRAGLGKTSLARVIANELEVHPHEIVAGNIAKIGDIMPYLVNIKKRDVLFIDEIHRLHIRIEEFLYSVMQDFTINIITENKLTGRPLNIPVQPFSLIGATTLMGNLSAPLRDRFGIQLMLDFYKDEELIKIIENLANNNNIKIHQDALLFIAQCARGIPRICKKLFYCVRDLMCAQHDSEITLTLVQQCFNILKIDQEGLENIDRKYLSILINQYSGGPAGIKALACSMDENVFTIENTIEPFLLRKGFIVRTVRGRCIVPHGIKHLENYYDF